MFCVNNSEESIVLDSRLVQNTLLRFYMSFFSLRQSFSVHTLRSKRKFQQVQIYCRSKYLLHLFRPKQYEFTFHSKDYKMNIYIVKSSYILYYEICYTHRKMPLNMTEI